MRQTSCSALGLGLDASVSPVQASNAELGFPWRMSRVIRWDVNCTITSIPRGYFVYSSSVYDSPAAAVIIHSIFIRSKLLEDNLLFLGSKNSNLIRENFNLSVKNENFKWDEHCIDLRIWLILTIKIALWLQILAPKEIKSIYRKSIYLWNIIMCKYSLDTHGAIFKEFKCI